MAADPAAGHRRGNLAGLRPAPEIATDRRLEQALLNLLDNAADASPEGLAFNADWTATALTIDILDQRPHRSGHGLPPRRSLHQQQGRRTRHRLLPDQRDAGAVRRQRRTDAARHWRHLHPRHPPACPTDPDPDMNHADRPTNRPSFSSTTTKPSAGCWRARWSAAATIVTTAPDVTAALAIAQQQPPEYAVVDLKMPGDSGLVLIEKLIELDPNTRIVMLTGYASIATAIEAIKLGATHYLAKPVDADEVVAALNKVEGDASLNISDSPLGRPPRVGAYPARARRARRQYLCYRAGAEDAPADAATEARQEAGQGMSGAKEAPDRLRLDKWLWAARFFKTRSLAADAIDGGKVKLNGHPVKPAREVKVGDTLDRKASARRTGRCSCAPSTNIAGQPRKPASSEETAASHLAREQAAEVRALAPPRAPTSGAPGETRPAKDPTILRLIPRYGNQTIRPESAYNSGYKTGAHPCSAPSTPRRSGSSRSPPPAS